MTTIPSPDQIQLQEEAGIDARMAYNLSSSS
jgi:hypothetical protein